MSAPMLLARLLLRGKFSRQLACSEAIRASVSSNHVHFDLCHRFNKVRSLSDESGTKNDDIESVPKKKLNLTTAKSKLTQKDDISDGSSSESSSDSDSSSDGESSSDEEIDAKLASSVDSVAEALEGDKHKIKSDLLQKLQDHVKLTKAQQAGELPPTSITSLISELKVKSSQPVKRSFGDRRQRDVKGGGQKQRDFKRQRQTNKGAVLDSFKLLQSPALGIFSPTKTDVAELSENTLFDDIEQERKHQTITYPPENAFEEMMRWTNEGKLWQFPINNEQGLEEEASVGFHEHVFLEHLLADFPAKGPVRHFMELVVVGLSKNPYITVTQKQEHIAWYKTYFEDKYKLIDELTIEVGQESVQSDKL